MVVLPLDARCSALLSNTQQAGASARERATGAAVDAALAANSEWKRAIEQLVEVRATMVRACSACLPCPALPCPAPQASVAPTTTQKYAENEDR